MLFYFWFVDVVLIVSKKFFEVFPQEDFQDVLYYECSVSKNISPSKVRKPPSSCLSTPIHKIKVVKVIEDVIRIFPLLLYV